MQLSDQLGYFVVDVIMKALLLPYAFLGFPQRNVTQRIPARPEISAFSL